MELNCSVIPIEKYVTARINILFKCKDCNTEWKASPDRILSGQRCPRCTISKGEKIIEDFLILNNIIYIPQKKFDGCIYKKDLKFDYYLIAYNTCIEFDGEQHFKENRFKFKKTVEEIKTNFENIKIRDSIKTKYCHDNNISLIRIPYWEIKNIETILTKELGL